MQRLASSFATLWILLFVPSLVVWLLIVRVSEHGTARFHATWSWLEDTLAYPLIFSPLSEPAWRWLGGGDAVAATAGFLLLVALWAVVTVLPFVLIAGWWRLIGSLITGNRDTSSPAYADGYAASPMLVPGRESSSPLAALYVVTLPLAILWNSAKGLGRAINRLCTSTLGGFLVVFAGTFLLISFLMAFRFSTSNHADRRDTLDFAYSLWYGWIDDLHVPRLFELTWLSGYLTVRSIAMSSSSSTSWPAYIDHWYRQSDVLTMIWVTGLRYGLAVASVYLVYRLARKLF